MDGMPMHSGSVYWRSFRVVPSGEEAGAFYGVQVGDHAAAIRLEV